ncbi:MAG TPA: DNA internalization-related competence protein ComEC/Rec2 [Thermoanaerobaculia bacterium]|nr:DNA internalization-related competence protein ComEC/Rec2 [Thermoanaerobaculia bacterium]
MSLRLGRCAFFAAIGIALTLHTPAIPTFHPDRFATIEAPIEHDWTERNGSFVLRASRFTANGLGVDTPISIYARFAPPEIAMERVVRVEAFLRVNEHGNYVSTVKSPLLLGYHGRLPWWNPAAWNRALANRLEPYAREHPTEVALAQALVLGRGERLDEALRENFRRGGTYHLLVFSGLQIAFAAGLLAALLRWLHCPRASDWLLLIFAILAPLFIGPTASVSRASLGIGLYAASRIATRPTSARNLWCVAALAWLVIEPRDLTDPSFHLTYAGAGALLFVATGFSRSKGGLKPAPAFTRRRWVASLFAAEVAITPLTLFHFHQYAIGGSLLTLVMSPLIFAMLVVSALAFAVPCDALFAVIRALHAMCEALNAIGLSGSFTAPPALALITGFGLALLAITQKRTIAIVLALLIPTIAAIVTYASKRSVAHPRITFLDVGQGDAILIRSGRRAILVDGGPGKHILPLLLDRGVRRLDAAVLTHAHPDHCEGLVAVVEHLDVGSVWISPRRFRGECAERLLDAVRATQTPIHLIRDRDTIALDDISLTAHVSSFTFRRAPENNASVVLRLETGTRRMLLTGDVEAEAELDLADRDLRADVLKVAHHGSRTSTADSFLERVTPRLAIISCGRRNLFGHPHGSVLDALRERGIRVWRTDRDGTIDVDVEGGKLYVRARKG